MNSPFWLVNSALCALAVSGLLFIAVTRQSIPERESIQPASNDLLKNEERSSVVNISQIYENDLFGTYKKELPVIKDTVRSIPFPEPPKPQMTTKFEHNEPKFLDPLAITLKGIIVISTSDKKSRAIITDNKTEYEASFKVGDIIEDAQLIRIFRNKVIFLRSNGQQEVLYLREQDAKLDPAYASVGEWGTVVQELGPNNYKIDTKAFTQRITNVAQLINLLAFTTAYKNGVSIGIQVGAFDPKSLGGQIGLQKGDIISSINGIPADTTENRLEIYKNVMAQKSGNTVRVKLTRNKQDITIVYTLYESVPSAIPLSVGQEKRKELYEQEKARKQAMDKFELAPTLDEIRKRDRQNMLEQGITPE